MDAVVEKYQSARPVYEGYALKLKMLLHDILESKNIKYQVIEARAKDVQSFQEKISRPGKSYSQPLKEITDLCGCRVIVYYQDDVAHVAEAIKAEFRIAEENLSRQPQLLEIDRFGYLSAHYIVSIGGTRNGLTEWKPYAEMVAEIQIRTVIQHAWSAVSHALQYKQEASIPSKLQRRLHRIAGLFELADEEFVGLRNERELLRLQARRDVERGDDTVPITAASLAEFLATWKGAREFVNVAERVGFEIKADELEEDGYMPEIYDTAMLAGIGNLGELKNALEKADKSYLDRVWKLNRSSGSKSWAVTEPFLVLLMLISIAGERVSLKFLLAKGFHDGIAQVVIKAIAKNSNTQSS
ncbi:GTP pyrophosphokinase [Tardiphaga sp. 813_E8_N1_3]|uniref:GTP pyrophosphokinase n=1 Tax=Tardiphaga sp. 813_E8_N1_3 TaxID=3240760 RepID=UPI003F28A899